LGFLPPLSALVQRAARLSARRMHCFTVQPPTNTGDPQIMMRLASPHPRADLLDWACFAVLECFDDRAAYATLIPG